MTMARGIISSFQKIARDLERQQAQMQREAIKAQNARERATKQAAQAAETQRKWQNTAAKISHVEARQSEVETLNRELEESFAAIDGLLAATLNVDNALDLNTLRREPEHPSFKHSYLEQSTKKPDVIHDQPEPIYEEPRPPKVLFGKQKKHEAAIAAAKAAHTLARTEWFSKLKENMYGPSRTALIDLRRRRPVMPKSVMRGK
jgi:restriction system protein